MKSTNYYDTFIQVAEDCKADCGVMPSSKADKKSVAAMQYEMLTADPYTFTSDDVIFMVYAERNRISASDMEAERDKFFSKGQACLRASPLAKSYGWGIHFDPEGKIALYGCGSVDYQKLAQAPGIKQLRAMKNKR